MLSALRQVFRSPRLVQGITVVVLVILALGIGATTAIFSVVSRVLLRPLPYPDAGRLVNVWTSMAEAGIPLLAVAHAEHLDYRAESQLLAEAGAFPTRFMVLTGAGQPAKLRVGLTTSSLWRVMGLDGALGRTFLSGEDQPRSRAHRHPFLLRNGYSNGACSPTMDSREP
jgi:putative ABC transport system permease protein